MVHTMNDRIVLLAEKVPNIITDTVFNTYLHIQKHRIQAFHKYSWKDLEFKYTYNDKYTYIVHMNIIKDGKLISERIPLNILEINDNIDIIFDIGAHHGLYTVLLGKINKESSIVAVEPQAENAELVRKNMELNKIKGEVIEAVISDRSGTKNFYRHNNSRSQRHTMKPKQDTDEFDKVAIKSMTVADLIETFESENPFFKIDAEGEEYDILQGICEYENIKDFQGIVEIHPDKLSDGTDKILQLLNDHAIEFDQISESSPEHSVSRPIVYFQS